MLLTHGAMPLCVKPFILVTACLAFLSYLVLTSQNGLQHSRPKAAAGLFRTRGRMYTQEPLAEIVEVPVADPAPLPSYIGSYWNWHHRMDKEDYDEDMNEPWTEEDYERDAVSKAFGINAAQALAEADPAVILSASPILAATKDDGSYTTSRETASIPNRPTRTLIIPASRFDNITWSQTWNADPFFEALVYHFDALNDIHRVSEDGRNEAMVYLTYIIEQYEDLPDISIFMHAGQIQWHNEGMFGSDSVQMLNHLKPEKVLQDGYVNLRCQLDPGCSTQIQPSRSTEDAIDRPEEAYLASAWHDLFPDELVPQLLGQPCFEQFSVSRQHILSRPLADYIRVQTWLLNVDMSDQLIGRIMDCIWQYLFTGQSEFHPDELTCYSELYGVFFADADELDRYRELTKHYEEVKVAVYVAQQLKAMGEGRGEGRREEYMFADMEHVKEEMDWIRDRALARGAV